MSPVSASSPANPPAPQEVVFAVSVTEVGAHMEEAHGR
jgi:hypothetical protein